MLFILLILVLTLSVNGHFWHGRRCDNGDNILEVINEAFVLEARAFLDAFDCPLCSNDDDGFDIDSLSGRALAEHLALAFRSSAIAFADALSQEKICNIDCIKTIEEVEEIWFLTDKFTEQAQGFNDNITNSDDLCQAFIAEKNAALNILNPACPNP